MSKLSFALSSLVAVIPAALMMYLLIMGFISGMPMMLMIVSGLAVLCAVGVVLLPILSFIIGPKAEKAPAAAGAPAKSDSVDEFEDFAEDEEEFEEMSSEDEFEMQDGADDWEDFEDDEFEDR